MPGKRTNSTGEAMIPRTSYLIFASPRTGSYLLCEALTNTGLAGKPSETFNHFYKEALMREWRTRSYADFFQQAFRRLSTPNGVFGTKIIWQFFEDFLDDLQTIDGYEKLSDHELLTAAFPDLHYIWITRRDKVRQAISYTKALQTWQWVEVDTGEMQEVNAQRKALFGVPTEVQRNAREPEKEVAFDFYRIDLLYEHLLKDEEEIQRYFDRWHIQPFRVVYEDFVSSYEETALRILDYLHIPYPADLVFRERLMKKQANRQTEEWVERYYEMKRHALSTQ